MATSRMTRQRTLILEALRAVTSHPTADEIFGMVREKLPRISLGTVYRNLDLLARSGDILRLERSGAQHRYDGNVMPHQHVRCRVCGRVGDVMTPVRLPPFSGLSAPGFCVETAEVEFTGLCDACRESGQSRTG